MPLPQAGLTESLDPTFARVERKMRAIVWLMAASVLLNVAILVRLCDLDRALGG